MKSRTTQIPNENVERVHRSKHRKQLCRLGKMKSHSAWEVDGRLEGDEKQKTRERKSNQKEDLEGAIINAKDGHIGPKEDKNCRERNYVGSTQGKLGPGGRSK
ncbi:hypothetical protein RUM44_010547 [Polyplax serrata]|uniref:Uncharacterized protein n=1 Tax=Polyplax serrata TaxID=468196 RepID=A0ABR1AVU6_POLSC